MRRYRRPNAGFVRRVCLQRGRRNFRCPDFLRARLVRLSSESLQPHSGWNAGWWTDRDCPLPMALATGICSAALVWVEISAELHRLADGDRIFAANHLIVSQTNRGRTPLLRSYNRSTVDDVDLVLRFNCRADFRNAARYPRSS